MSLLEHTGHGPKDCRYCRYLLGYYDPELEVEKLEQEVNETQP